MNIKSVKHTPLSIAVMAGRTAWQSWHKGGKYFYPTNNITKNDFEFLDRLFNKYKHLSVSEHIWFIVECDVDFYVPQNIKECNYTLISDDRNEIAFNLRTIYEIYDKDKNFEFFNEVLMRSSKHLWNLFFKEPYDENIMELESYSYGQSNIFVNYLFELKSNNFSFKTFRFENISRALLQEIVRHDDLLGITVKSTRYTLKELKNEDEFVYVVPGKHKGTTEIKYDFCRAKKYVILTDKNREVDQTIIIALNNLRKLLVSGVSNDIAKYALPEAYKTECIITYPQRNLQNLLKLRDSKDALWEFQRLAKAIKEVTNDVDIQSEKN
jgi:flavin-dependent thymidylate synthase